MTILHVACMPFPTFQGTQAALASMLRASSGLGRLVHLLTYARQGYPLDPPYPVYRIPNLPRVRSLRSGPSLGKLALDARCIVETRRLCERIEPEAIVAHHIEAAIAAIAADAGPVYYVAHTSLEEELPIYFPRISMSPIRTLAGYVEAEVCRRAAGVAAVAPSLVKLLGKQASFLPVPWPRSHRLTIAPREAKRALGLPAGGPVCLYAGNLDRYQAWEDLIPALRALRIEYPRARLLIASESDRSPARRRAVRMGLDDAVHFCGLAGERARQLAHAAADLAWIPRRTTGGLPIKMLDAFARGLPVVAMRRATTGLPIDGACVCVPDDNPEALAAAACRLLADQVLADRLRSAALAYLDLHHSAHRFDAAMCRLLPGVAGLPSRLPTRDVPPRLDGAEHPAGQAPRTHTTGMRRALRTARLRPLRGRREIQ